MLSYSIFLKPRSLEIITMKIKQLLTKISIALLVVTTANASLLPSSIINIEILPASIYNTVAPKTEIFIKNTSPRTVWITLSDDPELLISGDTLHIYSNVVELPILRIIMSKAPSSGIFFDHLVPNHAILRVNEYLH